MLAELELALGRATDEVVLVAQVAAAAKSNWRAAAWILERRYPERWARVRRPVEDEPTPPASEPDERERVREAFRHAPTAPVPLAPPLVPAGRYG